MIQINTELKTCPATDSPERRYELISYGSILPVEIPPEELERSRRLFHGDEPISNKLSSGLKNVMLANSDGRRCPTCLTPMRHLKGTKFGHEIADAATIEHVIPIALGGSSKDTNLAVRCNLCNTASGHTMNEWLQRYKQNPTWDSVRSLILYLWLETYDTTMSKALYPQLYDGFMRKREQLRTKHERGD